MNILYCICFAEWIKLASRMWIAGLRVQVYTSRLFAFHTRLPPKPQLLVMLWKAQIICFSHHTLPDAASSFAHHLKRFYHGKLQLFKSHSCLFIHLTCITFKWIQNLCWSPRIWTTESRYSTFISFHQIPQLQILNSIQTLNFTCKYKSLLTTAQDTTRLQNLIDVKTRQTLQTVTQYVTLWLIW